MKKELKLKVFERDGYKCCYCGSGDNLTVDHITPKSKGGKDIMSNLQALCQPCNVAKGNNLKIKIVGKIELPEMTTFAKYKKPKLVKNKKGIPKCKRMFVCPECFMVQLKSPATQRCIHFHPRMPKIMVRWTEL